MSMACRRKNRQTPEEQVDAWAAQSEGEADRTDEIRDILDETEQYQAGTLETYSSDDLRGELGLDR